MAVQCAKFVPQQLAMRFLGTCSVVLLLACCGLAQRDEGQGQPIIREGFSTPEPTRALSLCSNNGEKGALLTCVVKGGCSSKCVEQIGSRNQPLCRLGSGTYAPRCPVGSCPGCQRICLPGKCPDLTCYVGAYSAGQCARAACISGQWGSADKSNRSRVWVRYQKAGGVVRFYSDSQCKSMVPLSKIGFAVVYGDGTACNYPDSYSGEVRTPFGTRGSRADLESVSFCYNPGR